MAGLTDDALWNRVFDGILDQNGQCAVGLAAALESSVPENLRIPVPRNLMNANGVHSIVRIAHWAYQRVDPAVNPQQAVACYAYWLYGFVATKNNPSRVTNLADLRALEWDSEVTVLDEDCANIATPITAAEVGGFLLTADEKKMATAIVTLMFASKLTWFVTNHHLGSLGPNGERMGYFAKVARAMNTLNPTYNWDIAVEARLTAMYNLIHVASTRVAMRRLFSQHVALINPVFQLPGEMDNTNVWVPYKHVNINLAEDIRLRINCVPAGFARLADTIAGLRMLASSPIFVMAPGLDQIGAMSRMYAAVTASPLQYGMAARYLSNNPLTERADIADFGVIHAAVAVFIARCRGTTTLAKAACFSGDVTAIDNYSDDWDRICREYRRQVSLGLVGGAAAVEAAMLAAGLSVGGQIPATIVADLNTLHIDADINRLNRIRTAIIQANQQANQPQQPAPAPGPGPAPVV